MKLFNKQIFSLSGETSSVVLLCSSGVDSISAAHIFLKMFPEANVTLLHFNHNLREQNNIMASSFEKFAKTLSVPYIIKNLSCKDSTEDSCRKARMSFLYSFEDTTFITAHHLDDCVESYLLNCFRGKEGFLPIPFNTDLTFNTSINRPFLMCHKKDLIAYAKKNDLMQYVVEDETNFQIKGSRRNLLRNKIIPILEEEKVGLATIVKKKMIDRLHSLEKS